MTNYLPATEWPVLLTHAKAEWCEALAKLELVRDPRGHLVYVTGGLNYIVRARLGVRELALRCPIVDPSHNKLVARGKAIARLSRDHAWLAQTDFHDPGISFAGRLRAPLTTTEWVDGQSLSGYLQQRREDSEALRECAGRLAKLFGSMEATNVAHGDLHGLNIRVRPDGSLVLIDLDSLYAPGVLASVDPRCKGFPGVAHPRSRELHHGPSIDRFNALLLYTATRLLAIKHPQVKKVIRACDIDDEYVLFTPEDLERPSESALFALLDSGHLPTEETRLLLSLRQNAKADPSACRPFSENVPGALGTRGRPRAATESPSSALSWMASQLNSKRAQERTRTHAGSAPQPRRGGPTRRKSPDARTWLDSAARARSKNPKGGGQGSAQKKQSGAKTRPPKPSGKTGSTRVVGTPRVANNLFDEPSAVATLPEFAQPGLARLDPSWSALPDSSPLKWAAAFEAAPASAGGFWSALRYCAYLVVAGLALPVLATEWLGNRRDLEVDYGVLAVMCFAAWLALWVALAGWWSIPVALTSAGLGVQRWLPRGRA